MSDETRAQELLKPVEIGGRSLKNRVVLAPLTRARAGEARSANAYRESLVAAGGEA